MASEVKISGKWNRTEAGKCQCGCGASVTRMFKQGHDAKLKGKLQRAWAAGDREAGAMLLTKGWATTERLANLKKSIKAEVTDTQIEEAMAKLPS